MSEENEIQIRDIFDEQTYYQYQKQEHEKLLDADSKAYEDLKPLIEAQRASKGETEEDEEDAEKKIKDYLKRHNNGKENNEYLVRGAELQCSCGSHTRKLNLSPCHGVYIKGHPVVHELDCMQGAKDNITWFGVCSNEDLVSVDIMIKDENGGEIRGLKCDPEIVGIWIDSYEGTRIVDNGNKMQDDPDNPVGCNTLTVGSFLVCRNGGIISPVSSGQDRKVEIKEFVEGWNAYRRVTDFEDSKMETDTQDLDIYAPNNPFKTLDEIGFINSFIPQHFSNVELFAAWDMLSKMPELISAFAGGFLISSNINALQQNNSLNTKSVQKVGERVKEIERGVVYTPGQYIDNQSEWVDVKYGLSSMAKAGCEVMATYNALLSLGMDLGTEDVADLIVQFEKEGSTVFGLLGSSPREVYHYFKDRDYETVLSFKMEKDEINQIGEQYDTVIITVYNTSNDFGDQIHTVNIQKLEDGTFLAHNSVGAVPRPSLWEVITHMSQEDVSPISIIGISNPEGEPLEDEEG